MTIEIAGLIVQGIGSLASLVSVGAILYGIRAMSQAAERRANADNRRADAEAVRHTEAMRALEALIERTGGRA